MHLLCRVIILVTSDVDMAGILGDAWPIQKAWFGGEGKG